ncbi:MAG: hypothetical protein BWK79_08640, partial [Beggiatoa sp. IS2]
MTFMLFRSFFNLRRVTLLLAQLFFLGLYSVLSISYASITVVAGMDETISMPRGVAVHSDGSLYIADTGNSRIRKVDTNGTITTVAGNGVASYSGDSGPATSASLASPQGIAVDNSGNLYIADTNNHRIRKVSTSGIITTVAGTGNWGYSGDSGPAISASLASPQGIAVDSSGNLYIADTNNHRIRKVDTGGTITTVAGTNVAGYNSDGILAINAYLASPEGVTVGSGGDLYIADTYNHRIRKVDTGGTITTVAGTGYANSNNDGIPATNAYLYHPQGIAVDTAGNLYIADTGNNRIRKVDTGGTITTVAITGISLSGPEGITVDSGGNLYIADTYNNCIRKVDTNGVVTTVAGNGVVGYNGDNIPATSAYLANPQGVDVDVSGNLYIADTDNHRIRKVTSGTITTVAGDGVAGYSGDGTSATSARLNKPQGVAINSSGNLYIADTDNHRIRKVDTSGTITTVAGDGVAGYSGDGAPATSARLNKPQGVAIDSNGNLYIADVGNQRIRKVDTSGTITTIAGNGGTGYNGDGILATSASLSYQQFFIAVDDSGNLYIADTNNHRVRKVDTSGTISTVAGTGSYGSYNGDGIPATSAYLNYPQGIAIDSYGNLYINANNNYIYRVDDKGIISLYNNVTYNHHSLTVDSNNDVYSISGSKIYKVILAAEMKVMYGPSEIAVGGTVDFSEVITSQTKEITFNIYNNDELPLQFTGNPIVTVTGASFSVLTQPNVTSLGAYSTTNPSTTTFVVQFAPTTVGTVEGTISIANNDSDENPYTFTVAGEGISPPFSVQGNEISIASGDTTPEAADNTYFDKVPVGETVSKTFTIKNLSEGLLSISGLSINGDSSFGITNQPTTEIPILGSSDFTVQFAPILPGVHEATIGFQGCVRDYNTVDTSCIYSYAYNFLLRGDGIIVLNPIGNQLVALGETLTFTASANGKSTYRYFGLSNKPKGATIDPLTGVFNWLATEAGTFSATVIVTDVDNRVLDQENITITVGNTPPILTTIGNWNIPLGELLSFTITATDKESNALTFSLQNAPTGVSIDSRNGDFSWQTTKAGVFPMTVTVTDTGGLSTSETITVSVVANPVLVPIGDKTTTIGNTLTFTAVATHPANAPLTYSLIDSPTDATIDNNGTFNWTPTTGGDYTATIVVSETNGLGSAHETIHITVNATPTELSLALNSNAIFLNSNLSISGKLQRYSLGEVGVQPIQLQITTLDGNYKTATTQTNTDGTYTFTTFPAFDQEGIYLLQTQFIGTETLKASISNGETVTVSALAGYALLIQGRTADDSGTDTYNKSINRVYNILKTRGLIDENIEYLNYNLNQTGIQVDGTPSHSNITSAFNRLQTKMNADPAPLYIVMIDHGDADGGFHIDNGNGEILTPTDLSNWLKTLEGGLTSQALAQPRIITIGACYSGGFIPAVSLPGRIVITSAASNEESYKGPTEPDQVRSGEFFIEALFAQLGKGKSLRTAFELATQSTEILTRIDNDGFSEKYQDNAAQHPLLEDDGDRNGSNILYVGYDGEWAQNIYFGVGARLQINAPDAPAEILTVTPQVYLNVEEFSADLFAIVNNPTRVLSDLVIVDIRAPSAALPLSGFEQTEQLEITNSQRLFLRATGGSGFGGNFGQFTEAGKYDIIYFVQDTLTGATSPLRQSAVYKNKTGNNAPLPFKLRIPENEAETSTTVIFNWKETVDPDWDKLTYTLTVGLDPQFNTVIYQQTDLRKTFTSIDGNTLINDALNDTGLGLRDGTEYFWRVDAVDGYGAHATSETFSFTTNNTNAPPSVVSLNVISGLDFSELNGATLQVDNLPVQPIIQADQGRYDLLLPADAQTVTLSA